MRRVRSISIALVIVLVSSIVSGQQPKRKPEPYIAPILPAEQAWTITLPAPPAAGAAMDKATVYVPLESVSRTGEDDVETHAPAVLVALARESGVTRWKSPVESHQPPVLTHGAVVLATADDVQALSPQTGERQWSVSLDRPVRAPMIARGSLLLALLEGDVLVGIHLERREIAWRRSIGESGPVTMTADDQAVYLATAAGRVMRVMLADGVIDWERPLAGDLSAPTVDGDRLFVGSNVNLASLWSLDVRGGKNRWFWPSRFGAVVGTAVKDDVVYMVAKDNLVRALNRGNGNLRWKRAAGTRPVFPPRAFAGVVVVAGDDTLSTFRADSGAPISTWTAPDHGLLLQGAPLIDTPKPLTVSIVVVFRNGQVVGLTPTEMMLKEPALVPLTALPGRALPRETR